MADTEKIFQKTWIKMSNPKATSWQSFRSNCQRAKKFRPRFD